MQIILQGIGRIIVGGFLLVAAGAAAQTLPPCCGDPPILTELATRPAGATERELEAWLVQRFQAYTRDESERDLAALVGACEAGCPRNYEAARDVLARLVAEPIRFDSLPPCCEGRKRNASRNITAPPAPRVLRRQIDRPSSNLQVADPLFQRLLHWNGSLGAARDLLESEITKLPLAEVERLRDLFAGSCWSDRTCTGPLMLGKLVSEKTLVKAQSAEQQKQSAVDRLDEAKRHRDNLRLQRESQWTTLEASLLGGLLALFGACLGLVVLLKDRKRTLLTAEAQQRIFESLNRILAVMARDGRTRYPLPKRPPLRRRYSRERPIPHEG